MRKGGCEVVGLVRFGCTCVCVLRHKSPVQLLQESTQVK
jgi:hypothetical protein